MKISQRVIRSLCLFGLWLGLGLQAHAQTDTVTYVYTDPQGTPLVEADASGNVIARYDYTPYGSPVASLGSPPDGPGYTGHVNDPETGLVYMQARYYQSIGRFLSPDPVGPSPGNIYSFNRYAYVNNNPINRTDPDGRCADGVTCDQMVQSYGKWANDHPQEADKIGGTVGVTGVGIMLTASGLGELVGAVKTIILIDKVTSQTGEKVVTNLAKNAIKDDVKGNVRQIVKSGGDKQFRSDTASAMKGAAVKTVETERGTVQVGTHSDGSTVSARSFSTSDRPTIQVNQPNTSTTTKVRYEENDQ